MTLRELLAQLPPTATVPVGWLLERICEDPPPAPVPAPVPEPETWRERLWRCPADTRLTVSDLAEALGRPASWVYRRTSESAAAANSRHGRLDLLPHRRLGRDLVFCAGEVREWLRTHEVVEVPGARPYRARTAVT